MKFLKYAAASLVALVGLAFLTAFLVGDFEISVPEADAQAKLAAVLPVTVARAGFTAEVEGVRLDMLESGKVAVAGLGEVSGFGMSGDFTFDATSGVRYVNGAFFLTDLSLEDLRVTPTRETKTVIEDRRNLVLSTVSRLRDRLADGDAEVAESFDQEAGRIGTLVRERVADMMDRTIANTPVYDMNKGSWKIRTAVRALKDVQVREGEIVATVSAFSFLLSLLRDAAILIVAMLAAIGTLGWFISSSPRRA